jgi:uncharacterized protein (TIGR02145 family)
MNNSASSTANPSGVQGVCPTGWHLPSRAELAVLGNDAKLKATSFDNGTDDYGFSALPGGYGYSGGSFYGVGYDGNWWSASEYESSSSRAYSRFMSYNGADAGWGFGSKTDLFSVRCLQD